MQEEQEKVIKKLIEKYNDVLQVSMRLAVTDDFVNLMIANHDDEQFHLKDLIKQKADFSKFIMKEFLKLNSSLIVDDLKGMEEKRFGVA